MTREQVHETLEIAFETLAELRGQLEGDLRTDTAFALGEALGTVFKAKALVGRDIDDARERDEAAPGGTGVG